MPILHNSKKKNEWIVLKSASKHFFSGLSISLSDFTRVLPSAALLSSSSPLVSGGTKDLLLSPLVTSLHMHANLDDGLLLHLLPCHHFYSINFWANRKFLQLLHFYMDTSFEKYSKCRIWFFLSWHYSPIFALPKLTCLATLFGLFLAFFIIFVQ